MLKFKPTLVASAMAVALSSTATAVASTDSLSNIDKSAGNHQVLKQAGKSGSGIVNAATASGMPNQYDANLGQATFKWAGVNQAKPSLNLIPAENRKAYASEFYLKALTGVTADKTAPSHATIKYISSNKKGVTIAKFKQQVHGVEVFNKEYNVMMDDEYNLVAGSGYLAKNIGKEQAFELMKGFGSIESAIQSAFSDMTQGEVSVALTKAGKKGSYEEFSAVSQNPGYVIVGQPRAKRVIFDLRGKNVAAYYVEVEVSVKGSMNSKYYNYVVDATSGKVLFRNNLEAHVGDFTYRAYAHADGTPFESPHGDVIPKSEPGNDTTTLVPSNLITVSHHPSISTGDPWLPDDATTTSGNHAFAYADITPPQDFNEGDLTVELTSDKTFDFQLDLSRVESEEENQKAAIVNMFVMSNYLHDFYYDYGFDEKSGNAQNDNFGRGGEDEDALKLQAQDYSGRNNANMSTPADGRSPRMQQYLWNDKDTNPDDITNGEDYSATVTSHDSLGMLSSTQPSSFGPPQYEAFSGSVVRLMDESDADGGSLTDGCEAATNAADLAGKIAIIDRGGCSFTTKVNSAQQAGAIAAIIVNNTDDGTPAPMGVDPNDPLLAVIGIPSMGLNYADGHAIYALLDAGEDVTLELFSQFPMKDSSLDNGIIAHEYGHYIQHRLVGNSSGLTNFQGRSMGEGWADIHSMIFLVKKDDVDITGNDKWQHPYGTGTFVENFYTGIRRAPYSTNMDINPLTFKHIESGATPPGLSPTNVASPHGPGEIWAATLWEVYAAILNAHEFDDAQSRFVSYIIDGYKMTPNAPTYTEARDAILSVIYASDKDDYQLALAAFAKRGMGLDAVSPERFSTDLTGVVEGTATQYSSYSASNLEINTNYDGVSQGYCTADNILDPGETATVKVKIENRGSEVLSGTQVKFVAMNGDEPADVTFENDGLYTFADLEPYQEATSAEIMMTLNESAVSSDLTIKVEFPEKAEDDAIVEPAALSAVRVVNMDFEKRQPENDTAMTDMESFAMFDDFKQNIMFAAQDASGTQRMDTINTGFFQSFNPGVNLGTSTMRLVNNDFQSDVAVETDAFQVKADGELTLSFWHFYYIEATWDGAVVEISVDGDDWVDVTEAGGTFAVGYDSVLRANDAQALQDRPTFTGINGDLATSAGNMESISFGDKLNGKSVRFRFRISSDAFSSEFGWYIDALSITNVDSPVFSNVVSGKTDSCDNVAPRLTITAPDSVTERVSGNVSVAATDRNAGDTLSYSWTQTSGPSVTMSGADTATMSFTGPEVSQDDMVAFNVTVSDGTVEVSDAVEVKINNYVRPSAPPSSSGGSMFWLSLLLAPLAWVRKKKSS